MLAKTSIATLLLFAFATAASINAQDAMLDSIVDAHVKAIGGQDAITKVRNFKSKADVTLKGGFGDMSGTAEEIADIEGKRYYSDLDLGQFKKTEAMVGDSGWSKGTEGDREMDAKAIAFAKMSLGVSPLLSAYETAKGALKVDGTKKFNDKNCHVIAAGSDVKYFVDVKSSLLEGMKIANVGTIVLGDYDPTDGVLFPKERTFTIDALGASVDYKFSSRKTNTKIDDELFGDLKDSKESAAPAYTAEQIINFLDKDGDEKVSKEEAQASPELAPAFAFVDTSKDGFIDLTEAQAMIEYTKKENSGKPAPKGEKLTAKSLIASMDKNKDGKISKSEANDELKPFFADVDANSDGFIDETEGKVVAEYANQNR